MRYLRPKGAPLKIGEKTYTILFTLDIIDQLQDKVEMSINELLSLTTKKRYKKDAVKCILKYTTGETIEIPDAELEFYSAFLLSTYIDQIKFKDMPQSKHSESEEEFPFVNIAHWLYIGESVLNRPTEEVWGMTLGQLRALEYEDCKCKGLVKEDNKVVNIDDVI
jgi:hypothetical protein